MPAPGERLGPYLLEELLGQGAMGQVFRATGGGGEVVALKVLRPQLAEDDVYRRRFAREARVASTVRCDHLVSVVEAGEAEGLPYLAARFVDGWTLEEQLEVGGPLELAELVQLVADVAAGLDALHRRGLVHRDVKPSNVLVDEATGRAALTDFGLAKGDADTVLTRTGLAVGTPDFMAPEILAGKQATSASDVYALGCLAFACVAGRPPFAHLGLTDLVLAHLGQPPPDPLAAKPEAPAALGEAILQALAKRPGERPPTAPAFALLLAVAAQTA